LLKGRQQRIGLLLRPFGAAPPRIHFLTGGEPSSPQRTEQEDEGANRATLDDDLSYIHSYYFPRFYCGTTAQTKVIAGS